MNSNNSYIITGQGISMSIGGKPMTIDNTHHNYDAIKSAVRSGNWNEISDLVNLATAVAKYASTNNGVSVDVDNSLIYYQGEEIHNSLVSRIFDMMKDGFPIEPMTNLLANLYQNVSMKAIDELYDFLEYGKMPITEDGHFLAYKRVNDNYTSVYDSKTTNNIGEVTSLPRHKVDDRSEITCSYGLHVCSFEYLRSYPGNRVIVVKVNPADVVSIPHDYNNTKARVCRYEVIGELTYEEAGLTSHSFGTSVYVEEPKATTTVSKDNSNQITDGDLTKSIEKSMAEAGIDAMEKMVDNLPIDDVKNLLDLSLSGQLTDDELTQAFLKSKLNEIKHSTPKESEPVLKTDPSTLFDIIDDMFETAFGALNKALTDEPSVNEPDNWVHHDENEPPVSEWFKVGYTNGFYAGKNKIDRAPDARLEDDDTGTMILQNIIDVNVGYSTGYKDGRGHKSRQYPKTKFPG